MKTINEQREEIMQVVKDAIKATTFIDDGYAGEVRDLQEAAEAVADTLIEKGYREICAETCDTLDAVEYGVVGTLKGRIYELENNIYALREELRRVSEDSKERDNENLRLKSAVDELSEKNEYLEKALRNSVKVIEAGEKGLVEVGRKAVKEFAEKLKKECKKNFDTMDEQAVRLVDIDKLLIEYDFPECLNCEAFSGTDCTRNPYTEGCLKEENKK